MPLGTTFSERAKERRHLPHRRMLPPPRSRSLCLFAPCLDPVAPRHQLAGSRSHARSLGEAIPPTSSVKLRHAIVSVVTHYTTTSMILPINFDLTRPCQGGATRDAYSRDKGTPVAPSAAFTVIPPCASRKIPTTCSSLYRLFFMFRPFLSVQNSIFNPSCFSGSGQTRCSISGCWKR
jgi:hypothetical protein